MIFKRLWCKFFHRIWGWDCNEIVYNPEGIYFHFRCHKCLLNHIIKVA